MDEINPLSKLLSPLISFICVAYHFRSGDRLRYNLGIISGLGIICGLGIISGLGIICGPIWRSFAVLGSFPYSTRNEARVNALRASSFFLYSIVIFVAISCVLLTGNRLLMKQIRQLSLFMVKDTKQNNLYYFKNFFEGKTKKKTRRLLRKIK